MKKITTAILILTVGLLNAYAIWNTCIDLTGNFGKNNQRNEMEIKSFEAKLDAEANSLTVN